MHKRNAGYVLLAVVMGVVVVMALLTVMVMTSVSESSQSGSQGGLVRARGAAEAGISDASFYLTNQGLSDINNALAQFSATFAAGNNDASVTPIISNMTSGPTSALAKIQAIPNMQGTNTIGGANYNYRIVFNGMDVDRGSFNKQGQQYFLNYTISSIGKIGSYTRTVAATGLLRVRMGRTYLNQFVLLANDAGGSGGNYFTTGMNYDGPVHFNGNVLMAGTPSFALGVTTAATSVQMTKCDQSKVNVSGQLGPDACTQPDWGGHGIQYGVQPVPLPPNAYVQSRIAMGLPTPPTTPPTDSDLCAAAIYVTCTNSAPNGLYIPRTGSTLTGGFYIKGDAAVKLSVVQPGDKQRYDITANGVTSTLIVDYTANTTTFVGPPTVVVSGVPNGQLYASGTLTLTGPARTGSLPNPAPDTSVPSQVPPAVARGSKLNMTGEQKVIIGNDVTYQEDPRSVTSATNVLGIISGQDDVMIAKTAPNDIYIQAAILAGKSGKGLNVEDIWNSPVKGNIHLLGSIAEDIDPPRGVFSFGSNGAINMVHAYNDAFHFDQRFLNGGSSPPYYPATTAFAAQASWPEQQAWREQ